MWLISDYLAIKRNERALEKLQEASMDVYIRQAEVEREIIEHEAPEVREYLATEFEFQRAMNLMCDNMADRYGVSMPYHPPKTEDTIQFARLMASYHTTPHTKSTKQEGEGDGSKATL